jgi:hypothetical protein
VAAVSAVKKVETFPAGKKNSCYFFLRWTVKIFFLIELAEKCARAGTDVMIFQILSPKKSAKKLAFLTRNKAKL